MTLAAAHRRDTVGVVVRTLAVVVLLLVAYYQAPLDRSLTAMTGLLFATALVLLALALVVQVRGILVSPTPLLRAIRTLLIGMPTLLVVFAAAYVTIDGKQSGAFSEPLNRTDGLYFTVTTFATVGYGDITPVTQLARIAVTAQMVIGLIAVGLIAKVVLGAVDLARERNRAPRSPAEP
ncbi:MAG TPA: potassium channel family protein [Blastococcus sp.]|nr:potassium channel family protein [Blastococcus sp.]